MKEPRKFPGGAPRAQVHRERNGRKIMITGNERDAQAKACWSEAIILLERSGMDPSKARPYFGKLLSKNHLHPSELLAAVRAADSLGTGDPAGYLNKAAQGLSQARSDGALSCSWS